MRHRRLKGYHRLVDRFLTKCMTLFVAEEDHDHDLSGCVGGGALWSVRRCVCLSTLDPDVRHTVLSS